MQFARKFPPCRRLLPPLCVLVQTLLAQTLAQAKEAQPARHPEENHQIRRDKFDLVLPEVMRKRRGDMRTHVMREAVPGSLGADESGVFVCTDRGGEGIERAVLGRRWGAVHRS